MLRDPTESNTQRLLVTALGDYRSITEHPIPSAVLVRVMEEFDMTPNSTRTALSRLVKRGYLSRSKTGRTTSYELSTLGKQLVEDASARLRIFGQRRPWDGTWTIVTFSVTEEQRPIRHVIRSHLRALGFGPFDNGMWIAAFADVDTVVSQLGNMSSADVVIFTSRIVNLTTATIEKLFEAWDLYSIAEQYQEFIERFSPIRDRVTDNQLDSTEAFILRTQVMDAWRVFPRIDPELPQSILPPDWPLSTAQELFSFLYQELASKAEDRFKQFLYST